MSIKLEDLTPEQRETLVKQAKAEELAAKQKLQEDRSTYKELVSEHVPNLYKQLQQVSANLSEAKKLIFTGCTEMIDLKQKVYEIKEGQQSHTFTSKDGGMSITIGFRVTDGWDDTVQVGIQKVNEFIGSLVTDSDTEKLVNTINRLLQKDANGNLKSSRVLELNKIADEFNDPKLNDALEIIRKAFKPKRSCYYIEASYIDKTGKKCGLPLSISSVDFPEGTTIDFFEYPPKTKTTEE